VTMSSNLMNALLTALEQLIEEGIENRMKRYRDLALFLRKGLREANMEPFTTDDQLNPVLTAAYVPKGIDSAEVIKYLNEEYSIQISSGLGTLKPTLIRVGHMSPVITKDDIDKLCRALKQFPG
ncbi:MAG: aminotransferase class V-fold PLP-dependent enzyme, partial [Anaerolineaceae bacterium]|nr:aminotransferase class V-fold PLP-dependent enzyme [Anaerolineaceae bacterium]